MKKEMYEIIKENEKLIYSIAHKYSNYSNIDDLFQVGCIGLINAYKNYKKEANTKFSTYAYTYIVGEILSFIKNDKLIKMNSENKKICKLYDKAYEYLTKLNNRNVTIKEVSKFLNISEYDLYNAISNNYALESIDAFITNDMVLEDVIGEDKRDFIDTKIDLKMEMDKLMPNEKELIIYRYFNDFTQSQTASMMGMSQVEVSRNENKILKKMRQDICSR